MKERIKDQVCLYLNMVGETHKIEMCENLIDALYEGIVHFSFVKTDGSLRSAYGTLDSSIIARHVKVDKKRDDKHFRQGTSGVVAYFDLEKDDWRCFKADSIDELDQEYQLSF